jgi:hypothetical protein
MAEDLRNEVLVVDALFRCLAEKTAEVEDDALEATWILCEAGLLRLVAGDDDGHPPDVELAAAAAASAARSQSKTGPGPSAAADSGRGFCGRANWARMSERTGCSPSNRPSGRPIKPPGCTVSLLFCRVCRMAWRMILSNLSSGQASASEACQPHGPLPRRTNLWRKAASPAHALGSIWTAIQPAGIHPLRSASR